ncbi:galactose oxidase [Dacryopinax primogenitus]|uniref:Galactose oxidase n=1 Tax=Dacryopinax primogenitus (strain DJM 731) TaxID=1858805 RepID=M5FTS5_DACPD|nr:galactose oxidase [Dacryopinax primogenitus]EJT98844.1 galactose oxidase [Dacryopinax primogenitus]
MFPVSDLTTLVRKSRGEVPPQTAGPSTTIHDDHMFLFGGRLVAQRRMLSDMYVFDIKELTWEKIPIATEDDPHVPQPRYFHSADVWNGHIVIFGGMTDAPEGTIQAAPQPGEVPNVTVLNDVHLFNIAERRWLPNPSPPVTENPEHVPLPRYAHLSGVAGDRLYIIGGHGPPKNDWLDNVHVYDLKHRMWVAKQECTTHCGTYRSVAVCATQKVVITPPGSVDKEMEGFGKRKGGTEKNSLQHPTYSEVPKPDQPNGIYVYSNYNFMDVSRELVVMQPTPAPEEPNPLTFTDETETFANSPSLPPGLRFPTGAIIGTHLLLCGTYLAHTYNSFSLWSLDLRTRTWQRIDCGNPLSVGSWSRGMLWSNGAKFLIFGNRTGNLVEDYQRRLLSWTHVAFVDLEACGIYQPPSLTIGLRESELGLAALEEEILSDFEIVCDDGRKIHCSRRILDQRWPWFREQRRAFLRRVTQLLEAKPEQIDPSYPIEMPEFIELTPETEQLSVQGPGFGGGPPLPKADPRLTPRRLLMPEPYPIALAFVQYLYTYSLITPLQHAPPVLNALLVLSQIYELPHLQKIVIHSMHEKLNHYNAVSVYEMATVCNVQSLQIRSLKVVMGKNGIRGPRTRPDRHEPSTDGPSGDSDHPEKAPPRPRGMSNAKDLQMPPSALPPSGGSGGHTNGSRGSEPTDGSSRALASTTAASMPQIPEATELLEVAEQSTSVRAPVVPVLAPTGPAPPRPPRSAKRSSPPETPPRTSPTSPRPRLPSSLSMDDLRPIGSVPQGLGIIEPVRPSHERTGSRGSGLRRARSEAVHHRPSVSGGSNSFKSSLERRFSTRPPSGASSSSSSSLWGAGSTYGDSQQSHAVPATTHISLNDDPPMRDNPKGLRVKVDLPSWLSLGSKSRSPPKTPKEEQVPATPSLTPSRATSSPTTPNPLTPSASSASLFARAKSSKSPFSTPQRKVLDAVRRQNSAEESRLRKEKSNEKVVIQDIIKTAETEV